jgi:hypothetical protein
MDTKKKTLWESRGLPDLGNYTAKPTFFSKELMMIGKGVSPQFWKFTDIAWRNFLAPEKDGTYLYQFRFTLEQLQQEYHIHRSAVLKCVAAYGVCGFVDINKGKRHLLEIPGEPTVLQYRKSTTVDEWQVFVGAFSALSRYDRKNHLGGHDIGFQLQLAMKVRELRLKQCLPVKAFDDWLAQHKENGLIGKNGEVHRKGSASLHTSFERVERESW